MTAIGRLGPRFKLTALEVHVRVTYCLWWLDETYLPRKANTDFSAPNEEVLKLSSRNVDSPGVWKSYLCYSFVDLSGSQGASRSRKVEFGFEQSDAVPGMLLNHLWCHCEVEVSKE